MNETMNRDLEYTLLTKSNPVFKVYVIWSIILIFKMMLMTLFTMVQRLRKKAAASPEDGSIAKFSFKENHEDPDVERVRRAHLNDMENILPYLIVGLLYVMTSPGKRTAAWLYSLHGSARILHTIVYAVVVIPPPARSFFFMFAFGILLYMAIRVMIHFV